MDQLRKGLKTLGVLEQIQSNPDLYEKLFVGNTIVKSQDLLDKVDFEDTEDKHRNFFIKFLEESSMETLEAILIYITGTKFLPREKIIVVFNNRNDFFSSVCSSKLHCPIFENYEDFKSTLLCMFEGKSFTSV